MARKTEYESADAEKTANGDGDKGRGIGGGDGEVLAEGVFFMKEVDCQLIQLECNLFDNVATHPEAVSFGDFVEIGKGERRGGELDIIHAVDDEGAHCMLVDVEGMDLTVVGGKQYGLHMAIFHGVAVAGVVALEHHLAAALEGFAKGADIEVGILCIDERGKMGGADEGVKLFLEALLKRVGAVQGLHKLAEEGCFFGCEMNKILEFDSLRIHLHQTRSAFVLVNDESSLFKGVDVVVDGVARHVHDGRQLGCLAIVSVAKKLKELQCVMYGVFHCFGFNKILQKYIIFV